MSNSTHCLPSNPDISGIGVRTAVYAQNLLSFVPAVFALQDKKVTPLELDSLETQSTTILITAFAILVSVIVQALKRGLTNYHAAIILNLSWMNNTNLFIYFLLYVFHHTTELPAEGTKHGGRQTPLRSIWTESGQTKKAWKNPVFIIGSIHLSIMSAVGIWLWTQPVTFGNSKPCSLSASLVVVGQTVPIGSHSLREWSLLAYSLLLTPALNLIIPIGFFAVPVWIYSRFTTFSLNRETGIKITRAGLAMLAVIDVLLLADTEASIRKNRHLTDAGDTEWTFGQTLAILLLLIPLRDIGEALLERRPRRLSEKLLAAAEKGQLHVVQDAMKSGASRTIIYPAIVTSIQNGHWGIVEFLLEVTTSLDDTYTWLKAASAGDPLNLSVNALFSAAEKQHVQAAGLLAKLLGGVNTADENGRTALHSAAKCGNLEAVKLFAKLQADINARDENGWTALHYAAYNGSIKIVELLSELNADTRATARDGRTALELAAIQGKIEVVGYLVEPSVDLDLNGRGWYVWAALQYISDSGNMEVARFLNVNRVEKWEADFLKHLNELAGDDATVRYSDHTYALQHAAKHGHTEVINFLAELGIDLNVIDSKCWAALHYAVDKRHTRVVKLLVAHGADLNVRGDRFIGLTPLHNSARHGDLEMVKLLVELNADVNAKCGSHTIHFYYQVNPGWTALHFAAEGEHLEVIKFLAELGVDLNARCDVRYTALHYAARRQSGIRVIRLLAALNADIDAKGVECKTPLYVAALYGNSEGVKVLAELGADLNAMCVRGKNALHIAAENGCSEVVKVLAELKVDINSRAQNGRTALHCAAAYGHSGVIKLLAGLRVDVDATGKPSALSLCIYASIDIVDQDKDGQTPLHLVASSASGNVEVAKFLLEAGVDPNVRDHNGKSALDIALVREGSEVVDFLSTLQAEASGLEWHDSPITG